MRSISTLLFLLCTYLFSSALYAQTPANTQPVAVISAVGSTVICPGNFVVLNANTGPGYTYQWFNNGNSINGANSATYNAANSGAYTVRITVNGVVSAPSNVLTISAQDLVAPVFTSNEIITTPAQTDGSFIATSAAGAMVHFTLPTATDNCSGVVGIIAIPASGSVFPIGATTVTVVARDAFGNRTTKNFTVVVKDDQAPRINCIPTQTFEIDSANHYTLPIITATDNTDSVEFSYVITGATNRVGTGADASGSFSVGTSLVTFTVKDLYGNASTCRFNVVVQDAMPTVIQVPTAPIFCENKTGAYAIPLASATGNFNPSNVNFTITGATQRTGTGFDVGAAFNVGTSIITYTVVDVNGHTVTASLVVTVNKAPIVTISPSNPDAYCNQLVLTSNSTNNINGYAWTYNNNAFANTPSISLNNTNGDGAYSLVVKDANGCASLTPSTYIYAKQTVISNYTILAFKAAELKERNFVQTGSVGVMNKKGFASIGKNSTVSSAGAFVKAPKIELKQGAIVPTRLIGLANINLPTMQYSTANVQNRPNYQSRPGATATLNGDYKNLMIKRGSNITLTGSNFGNIHIEEGAIVRFTNRVVNMAQLQVGKGPHNGQTKVRFVENASIRVSKHVQIEEDCFINPDRFNITFYLGNQSSYDYCNKRQKKKNNGHDDDDDDDDDDGKGKGDGDQKFEVRGGNTTVIANVYAPTGKIIVKGSESCHKSRSTMVYMTGLFIGYEVEGDGKSIFWNNYQCGSASPIAGADAMPVFNKTTEEETITEELKVTVMPNPSTTYFTLKLVSQSNLPVNIKVVDAAGRLVEGKAKQAANSTLQLGHNYPTGNYFAEFIQGNQRKVVQLMKIK